jgi:signal transduction histidine kinase/CheY-like chemotaxis protein
MRNRAWEGELQQITKTGQEITVESRWTLVKDFDHATQCFLVVNTDITQKKLLESQFLRAQRLESIGTLASGIAHDLNNVLAPILMTAQLLESQLHDERSQRLLPILISNAKRGANLVKQVLSFTRGMEGDRTLLQLKHIVREIQQVIRETFPKSLEVSTCIPSNLWTIYGDATQLHQVLMNLCVNARDAMPNGGTLKISAENFLVDENYARMHLDAQVGSYIAITVGDTGVGIAPEILDRIFEPFYTTKEFGKGTGLGLSTVLGIIKSHGGFINVYSEIGKGSQFKVFLPAQQTPETLEEPEKELPSGNGELILVVDDEDSIRDITKTSLEIHNYKAITACDGIEAIALYAEHRDEISVVLTDMLMPSMDGLTTIRTLKKINPNVKIIAVSGLASTEKVNAAADIGVKAFLSKPYTAKQLLQTIGVVKSGK